MASVWRMLIRVAEPWYEWVAGGLGARDGETQPTGQEGGGHETTPALTAEKGAVQGDGAG